MVKSIRIVDEVIVYTDVDETIKNIEFDIFCVGEDQNHAGFQRAIDFCKKKGKQVVYMTRTPNISSTYCKNLGKS
ncbi:MAG: hypothetical protein IJZ30_02590 [Alphaproteobacteria bacterium]|nr:hypothetical protein [Alphaproteobacteria bacterium]